MMEPACTPGVELEDSGLLEQLLLDGNNQAALQHGCLRLSDEDLPPEQRARLMLLTARAGVSLSMTGFALDLLDQALDLLEPSQSEQLAAEIRLEDARARIALGNFKETVQICRSVREQALEAGWTELAALSAIYEAVSLRQTRSFEAVLEVLAAWRPYYLERPQQYGVAQAESAWCWSLIGSGQIAEGVEIAEPLLERLLEQGTDIRAIGALLNCLCYAEWCRGDFRRMIPLQQQLIDFEKAHNPAPPLAKLLTNQGSSALLIGNFAQARELLLRAWAQARSEDKDDLQAEQLVLLAVTELHHFNPQQALSYMQLAQERVRTAGADSAALRGWHLPIVLLANGAYRQALQLWEARSAFPSTTQSWYELQIYRAVLQQLVLDGFPTPPEGKAAAMVFAREWLDEVRAAQALIPRPSAIDEGQVCGGID